MTRDEMVELMVQAFQSYQGRGNDSEVMDFILGAQEKAGMRAPEIDNPKAKGLSGFTMQYESIPYKVNEWEK